MDSQLNNDGLASLGYDEWFRQAGADSVTGDFSPARVVEVNKGNYRTSDGGQEMLAELSGRFMFAAEGSADFPTVGDWVVQQAFDGHSRAIIHGVMSRKTLLKRKEPGRKVGFQLLAANIDCGLVVHSADAFTTNGLERYLVMLNENGIRPMVVFSKIDLLPPSGPAEIEKRIAALNTACVFISNLAERGVEALIPTLEPQKTYCLLGPSGSGKTSLLNRLLGEDLFRVNEVREKDGRGRHTTVRRQLIRLESGSIFIDTPGMRELGNFDIAEGLEQTFEEIPLYGAKCRYRDCTHVHEEGCAVIEAVGGGAIDAERYQNYLKLKKESEFYEMSYREKRKKDKAFGKRIKNYTRMNRDNGGSVFK